MLIHLRHIVLLAAFVQIVWAKSLWAQTNEIRFDHFSVEQGVAHKNVNCLLQDSKGYIWIGTKNGLNFYNGYQFDKFYHNPEDPTSLSSNNIQALYEDREGYIWVGTADGGLNRLDPNTGTCKVYSYNPMVTNGIGSNNVCAIHQDRQGFIWIGTFGGGLSKLNVKTGKFKNYYKTNKLPQGLSSNNVITIHEDRAGALWLGTYGGGLCKLLPKEETFTVYMPNPANPASLSGKDVYAVKEDHNGYIWVGTNGGGLSKLNQITGQFVTYRSLPGKLGGLSNDYIHAIEEDALGYLWIGTVKDGGLNRFDPVCEKFQSYTYDQFDLSSISNNNINAILADRSGTVWVATEGGGVNKFEVQSQIFRQFVSKRGNNGGFIAASVTALFEDKDRLTWIGTTEGLYSYEAATDTYTYYDQLFSDRLLNLSNTVNALCEDNSGRIWVGTADNGLLVYDKKKRKFKKFESDPFNPGGLTSDGIEALYKDRSGIIWVGTYDGGLCRLDPQRETFVSFQHDPNNPRSIASNSLKIIYEDALGNLWIGTKESGLSRFDPKTQTFTNYSKAGKGKVGLTSNSITAIAEADGSLWIGTIDGGICQFNPKAEAFTNPIIGLPEDNICGIVTDRANNLWISTASKGIVRYTPKHDKSKKFTVAEGLYSNEFQHCAYFQNQQGELYFGGANHFIAFDPAKILDKEYISPVYITNFTLMGEKKSLPLHQSEIVLNYDQNFLEFEFVMLSYLDPSRNQYAYILEGVDKNWNYIGNRRQAPYTNLDPNEYIFRVKAADKNNVWNDEGISIRIIIKPAWYNTWWARTIFIVLVVGSGLAYYRQRIHSIEKQKKVLEALVQERTTQLVHKNQEIEAQKNSIEEKNISLQIASTIIEEKNEELKAINNALESRVEQRTRELKKANDSLVSTNHELDMFIYRASHDIKGPVATLSGLCKIAALDIKEPKALEYISLLDRTCDKANQTLVRILGIYEIRNSEIKPDYVCINNLICELAESARSSLGSEKVKFHLEGAENVILFTDPSLLRTILTSLIDNAFKYSKRREASYVKIYIKELANEKIAVEVRDNGIGIAPELRSKLFTMFFRGTVNTSGTGLGLYISRIATERLSGKINLLPYETDETVFEVFLPKKLSIEDVSESEIINEAETVAEEEN